MLAASAGNCATSRGQTPDGQASTTLSSTAVAVAGIALQADGLGDAEGLAGRHVADHDLFAGRRGLAGAYMAVQQHEEGVRFLALLEIGDVLGKPDRTGLAQDRVEVRRAETPRTAAGWRPANVSIMAIRRTLGFRNLDRRLAWQRSSLNLRWRNKSRPPFP